MLTPQRSGLLACGTVRVLEQAKRSPLAATGHFHALMHSAQAYEFKNKVLGLQRRAESPAVM